MIKDFLCPLGRNLVAETQVLFEIMANGAMLPYHKLNYKTKVLLKRLFLLLDLLGVGSVLLEPMHHIMLSRLNCSR